MKKKHFAATYNFVIEKRKAIADFTESRAQRKVITEQTKNVNKYFQGFTMIASILQSSVGPLFVEASNGLNDGVTILQEE